MLVLPTRVATYLLANMATEDIDRFDASRARESLEQSLAAMK